jgi:biopolymer transport protein ExbD
MAETPEKKGKSRFRGGPDEPGSSPPKEKRRLTDGSALIDPGELDAAFHHVDELAGGAEVRFGKRDLEETEMDMTPMVDVTFLLLIFFMVTAAFSLQKSLQVPTPRPDEPSQNVQQRDPQEDPDMVTVHVDEFNTFRVVTTDWEEEAPSDQELLMQLRKARAGNAQGRVPTKLLVMANGEAMHEKVVRALDAGTEVGMDEIQLMMVEEDQL